jgi:hypothetical protein
MSSITRTALLLPIIFFSWFKTAIGQVPQIRSNGELRPMTCDEIMNPAVRTFSIVKVNGTPAEVQRISANELRKRMAECEIEDICIGREGGTSVRICCSSDGPDTVEPSICWEVSTDGQVNIGLILPNQDEVGIQLSPEKGFQLTGEIGSTP